MAVAFEMMMCDPQNTASGSHTVAFVQGDGIFQSPLKSRQASQRVDSTVFTLTPLKSCMEADMEIHRCLGTQLILSTAEDVHSYEGRPRQVPRN